MKMRKIMTLVLAVAMIVTCFAACGGNTTTNNPAAGTNAADVDLTGTYKITMWVSEKEGVADQFKQQIAAFEAANPGIKIEASIEGVTEADAGSKIVNDVATAPDIYCFAQDQLARLVQAKALAKPGKGAAETIKTNNDAGSVAAATVAGELYAYPMTSDNGYYMYYDKSIISDADAESLEKIIAACEANNKVFRFALENAWYTASFFFATGGKSNWTMNEKGEFSSVEDTINSAEGLIAMKGMQKLAQSKCYDSNADIFTDAGVVITGIWAAGDAAAHFGDNLGAEAKAATGEDDLKTALTEYKAAIDGLFQMTDAQKNAWSVIGNICNTNWDTDIAMTEGPDGTFTSDVLELKAGQEYKVRQGASWDVNFGAEGFNSSTNCVVEADGKYKVQLVWDGAQTGTITLIPVEG